MSQLNAFDFIVTVGLGSTLATVILSKYVAIVDGVLALPLLIGLQLPGAVANYKNSRKKLESRTMDLNISND